MRRSSILQRLKSETMHSEISVRGSVAFYLERGGEGGRVAKNFGCQIFGLR